MKLETILSTGFTTQPRLDRLIKQMFKLTKICVELIGTIVSYYEDCFVHTSIVYNPLILMYNFGLRASIDVSIHHDWLYATSTM